jgi:hypothetical protein
MRRPLLLLACTAAACAATEDAQRPAGPEPTLVEPTEHPPAPDRATLPRDLKALGGMIPRWAADGGPWAALGEAHVFQLLPRAGQLRALALASGREVWRVPVYGVEDPALPPRFAAGRVILPTAGGLWAANAEDAEEAWRWPGAVEALAGEDPLLVLGTPPGEGRQLLALDPATGAPRWAMPCAAPCALLDAVGDAALVLATPGRVHRVEAGAVRLAVEGEVVQARLLGDGVALTDGSEVKVVGPAGPRFARPMAAAALTVVQGLLLVTDAEDLVFLDPRSGADRARIHLDPALAQHLLLSETRRFPEGELLVPTSPLFGAAAAYLLIRDDGTLRAVRYGLPDLVGLEARGALALYRGEGGVVLSGTRRRGAPVRHYETVEEDLAERLATLATPPTTAAVAAAQARARAWLGRLGREVTAEPLHAAVAKAGPGALWGLLPALSPEAPEDREVLAQALLRVAVTETDLPVAQARRVALSALAEDLPEALLPVLEREAPRWLTAAPAEGFELREAPLDELLWRVPEEPGARARALAVVTRATVGLVVEAAARRGRAGPLLERLAPVQDALRAPVPCPWPASLRAGPSPRPHRCPLTAPPPGAHFAPDAAAAAWRAAGAGDRDDVWLMTRRGARWSAPLLTGLTASAEQLRGLAPGDGGGWRLEGGPALPAVAELARDQDKDGLTDLLERRLGTDPRRADSDGDGAPDPTDGSPACAATPADEAEALRRQVALQVAGLTPSPHGAWQDLSPRCLPLGLAGGPLLRLPAPPERSLGHPGLSQLTVEVLEGEAQAEALREAQASGQLRGDPTDAVVIQYTVRHGPLDGFGATVIFTRGPEGWRPVAEVRRWIS